MVKGDLGSYVLPNLEHGIQTKRDCRGRMAVRYFKCTLASGMYFLVVLIGGIDERGRLLFLGFQSFGFHSFSKVAEGLAHIVIDFKTRRMVSSISRLYQRLGH